MHTRVDIALCNLPETDSLLLSEKIYNEIKRIEKLANHFDSKSEISKVNSTAAQIPVEISSELYYIILGCIRYNKKTKGAFDITVNSKNNYRGGIQDIVLNQAGKTVFFKNENVQIDLCGYIKGYALSSAKKILIENGCFNALISMGNSSVFALGNHPNGKGWKINLPEKETETVTLFNQCLTTSGNTDGHIHIVNPKTGQPPESKQVISVVTRNAVAGEVLSTALCVSK